MFSIGIAAVSFLFFLRWQKKALVFILFLLPFSFALNPLPGFDLQLLRVFVPLFWLAVFLKHPSAFIRETKTPIVILVLLFLGVSSLVTLFAPKPLWSLRKLGYLWSFTPLIPALSTLFHNKPQKAVWSYYKALFAGGAVVSIVGIVQFISQFFLGAETVFHFFVRLAPYFHGREFGALVAQYPSWFVQIGSQDYLRAFAFFPDPHIFAFYLVFLSSLVLAVLLKAPERRAQPWTEQKNKKEFVVLVCVYILLVAAILFTFSRGGYMGFIASSVSILWLMRGRAPHKALAFSALGVGAVVFLLVLGTPIINRFSSSFNFSEGSNTGRLQIWSHALAISKEHIFGVGLGNYAVTTGEKIAVRNPITAHNLYLDILVETGFLGLGFFLWSLLYCFGLLRAASKNRKARTHALNIGLFGALLGFSTHAFFENPLWAPALLVLLLWALAASTAFKPKLDRELPSTSPPIVPTV